MNKKVHHFSDEYLERSKKMTTAEIVRFLESYRRVCTGLAGKSRQVSLKVPEHLLHAFRVKAELEGTRYQTQIKKLMRDWLEGA